MKTETVTCDQCGGDLSTTNGVRYRLAVSVQLVPSQPDRGWNTFVPAVALQSPDYKVLRKLRQQYLRHLEPFLDRDRGIYEAAVKEATGWTSKVYAAKYGAFWERYEDARVDLKWAARDLGCTPERLHAAVMHQVQLGKADVVLSVFALKGPRARTLGFRQWLEVYPLAQQYLAAAPPQAGVKQ